MCNFIPTKKTTVTQALARLFYDNIVRLHGVPEAIITQKRFVSYKHSWQ